MDLSFREARVQKVSGGTTLSGIDVVAVEEPLTIRLQAGGTARTLSITMRTPGHDGELALGLAFAEGLVATYQDMQDVIEDDGEVTLVLRDASRVDPTRLDRLVVTSSACGACGKTSLAALATPPCAPLAEGPRVSASCIHALPAAARAAQETFARTGGLHAAALFDREGSLVLLREDVGRHNALDKLVGAMLDRGHVPLSSFVLLVSGRASFELVQKARVAGIPILAAVGAPSSLAIDLAARENMTLLGFVRDERFNVYCGSERIEGSLSR